MHKTARPARRRAVHSGHRHRLALVPEGQNEGHDLDHVVDKVQVRPSQRRADESAFGKDPRRQVELVIRYVSPVQEEVLDRVQACGRERDPEPLVPLAELEEQVGGADPDQHVPDEMHRFGVELAEHAARREGETVTLDQLHVLHHVLGEVPQLEHSDRGEDRVGAVVPVLP